MRDRFKKGNKDRRNQPPGGTPEVCSCPPMSQSEVNLVCHCNHSILQSVGIVEKKKKTQENNQECRLDWCATSNCSQSKKKHLTSRHKKQHNCHTLLLPAEPRWGNLKAGEVHHKPCVVKKMVFFLKKRSRMSRVIFVNQTCISHYFSYTIISVKYQSK